MVHLNHEGPRAKALWADVEFKASVARWTSRKDAVLREPVNNWWFLLDAREPLDALMHEGDQAAAFKRWMMLRTEELIDDGIIARLVAVQP